MKRNMQAIGLAAGCAGGLVGLPLLGVRLKGGALADYLEFPPLTLHVGHAPFSWPVFIAMALFILAAILPFDLHVFKSRRRVSPAPPPVRPFPRWGWAGFAILAAGWWLAWTRYAWWAPFQLHTFSMLWIGYIAIVNAWLFQRTGRSLPTHRPRYLALLFAASAGFWWFFEYLNRFVQNWLYVGVDGITGLEYFWLATLPFSTVLPAVMSTWLLLRTFPKAGAGLDDFVRLRLAWPRPLAWLTLGLASFGLVGVGLWPDQFYPLLWVAPLLLLTACRVLTGRPTLFAPLAAGRWRDVYLLCAAGLTCGFFWELWNYGSMAKWDYLVPYVDRFLLFEMPLLGYAGYIPFGLECAAAAALVGDPND
jgi:hypothetical protein